MGACPDCGGPMVPLFSSTYCKAECDKPKAALKPGLQAALDDFMEEDTQPMIGWSSGICPKCAGNNTGKLTGGMSHCWTCGGVW